MVELLLRIGLVRRKTDGSVRWPVSCNWQWTWWKIWFWNGPFSKDSLGGWFGVFRNRPGVIKWEKGRLLPRRWGIRVFGFEFGDRG